MQVKDSDCPLVLPLQHFLTKLDSSLPHDARFGQRIGRLAEPDSDGDNSGSEGEGDSDTGSEADQPQDFRKWQQVSIQSQALSLIGLGPAF